jgi:hypothetical protein
MRFAGRTPQLRGELPEDGQIDDRRPDVVLKAEAVDEANRVRPAVVERRCREHDREAMHHGVGLDSNLFSLDLGALRGSERLRRDVDPATAPWNGLAGEAKAQTDTIRSKDLLFTWPRGRDLALEHPDHAAAATPLTAAEAGYLDAQVSGALEQVEPLATGAAPSYRFEVNLQVHASNSPSIVPTRSGTVPFETAEPCRRDRHPAWQAAVDRRMPRRERPAGGSATRSS